MEEKKNEELSEQETKIIEFVRNVNYGEIKIVINAGKPIRVEEIRKSFML